MTGCRTLKVSRWGRAVTETALQLEPRIGGVHLDKVARHAVLCTRCQGARGWKKDPSLIPGAGEQ